MKLLNVPRVASRYSCFLYFILFFILLYSPFSFAANKIPKERSLSNILQAFDDYVKYTMIKTHEPGCAIAVVYQNKIVFMKTYGWRNAQTREKIDFGTLFQLGSVSKTYTASLAAVLNRNHLLSYDRTMADYLPDLSLGYLDTKKVQIKHLLNHTTGIPRAGFNQLIERHYTHEQLIAVAGRTPPSAKPGEKFDYHNMMYSLLGDVIESSTQTSYSDALEKYLLQPLNMQETTSTYQGLLEHNDRAQPHVINAKGVFVPAKKYSTGYYAVAPSAGVSSSIRDMATYLNLQLGAYPAVLNKHDLAMMHYPTVDTTDELHSFRAHRNRVLAAYYGLGWRILNFSHEKLVFHGGWVKGFTNFIGFIPRYRVGIVILHNAETRFPTRTAMKFFDLFLGLPEENW